MRWTSWVVAVGLFLVTGSVHAHFVWIGVEDHVANKRAQGTGQTTVRLWFNETSAPGSARLINRLAPAKAWLRSADGNKATLDLHERVDGEAGAMTAEIDAQAPFAIGAECRYGVFTRGAEAVLLQYYAKHLSCSNFADNEGLARDKALPLDIVPHGPADGMTLEALWHGKPAVGLQFVVCPPEGAEQELTTDQQGRVKFSPAATGLYGFRVRYVEPEASGEDAGKKYHGAHYYATLTMHLSALRGEELTANELLERARDARATWEDFPGFSARMKLQTGEKATTGEIKVAADGSVSLQGLDDVDTKSVQGRLESLIQHRFSGGGPEEEVEYVEEPAEHPLGRLLRFKGDEKLHSAYRVRGDVITEVNRETGPTRFSISVLEIHRNPEGKYLPQAFNVSFWDSSSGDLKSTETHLNLWTRVGEFDLPARLLIISGDNKGKRALQCELSEHRLGSPPANNERAQ